MQVNSYPRTVTTLRNSLPTYSLTARAVEEVRTSVRSTVCGEGETEDMVQVRVHLLGRGLVQRCTTEVQDEQGVPEPYSSTKAIAITPLLTRVIFLNTVY